MSASRTVFGASRSAAGAARRFVSSKAVKKATAEVVAPTPQWVPPAITFGATHLPRYNSHYDETLASDLLYMTYNHRASSTADAAAASATSALDQAPAPVTGYEANRPVAPPRGNRPIKPVTKGITAASVPRLESITVHTMIREAVGNKHALLSAIMALRAIGGESTARSPGSGVQVVVSRNGAAAFKLRAGMPIAAKITLRGEAAYTFVQSLVDFVLPRLREFPGFTLPASAASKNSPSALGGVVSVGLPPAAMGLFPQIEANIDAYPKLHGMHIHFNTTARGKDAQEHARALLSGFRIPFTRK